MSASTSLTCSCFFAAAGGGADSEQLGLSDQIEACFCPAKAHLQRSGGDADFFGAAFELGQ